MFSVLTLNLRFGLSNDGANSWPNRKKLFPLLLPKYPADFYCFQEANDFQITFLQNILKAYKFVGQRRPAPAFWQNNVIFFHHSWQCVHLEHLYLSPTPEIPSRYQNSKWPRQCTIAVLKKHNRKLICVNTHFDFESQVQDLSAILILKRLDRLNPSFPTLLAGDFNADPSSSCYSVFTSTADKAGEPAAGFKNSFTEPYPGTHHGFTGSLRGDHIDWILFRGDVRQKGATIVTDSFDGCFPSDHFPLTATFSWLPS